MVRLERDGDVRHLLAERNRYTPLASIVSHGALILVVMGMGFVTPRFGYETSLKIPVGEVRPTGLMTDPDTVLVRNENFVAPVTLRHDRRPRIGSAYETATTLSY